MADARRLAGDGRRRTLKFTQLFTLLFGTIVGVGWIAASGLWIKQAGPWGAIIAFGGGAIVMILIGLCFAEMMTLFPESGGSIGYACEAFGPDVAFATGWLLILCYGGTNAFFMIILEWILGSLTPRLAGPELYRVFGSPVHAGFAAIGVVIAALLALANYLGAATAARAQDLVVFLKISIAVALAIGAVFAGHATHLQPAFASPDPREPWAGVLVIMLTAPFWFTGFDVLPQVLRERHDGVDLRKLGALIVWTTFAAFVFYATVILATGSLVPRTVLLTLKVPTYEAFRSAFDTPLPAYAVLILGLLGIVSAWNAMIFAGARVLQVMSASHLMSPVFAPLAGRYGTPGRALLFFVPVWTAVGLLGSNAVNGVIAAVSIAVEGVFLVVCCGVIRLRWTAPERSRPYRVPGGLLVPVISLVLSLGLLVLSLVASLRERQLPIPLEWIMVIVWALAGWASWRLSRHGQDRLSAEARRALLVEPLPRAF